MIPHRPIASLPTHNVTNMPPYIGDQQLWHDDPLLRHWVAHEGARWASEQLAAFGAIAGAAEVFDRADRANRYSPTLKAYDRYGMRINQVEFHPDYHHLMDIAISNQLPNFGWNHDRPGAHVAHAAQTYMYCQPEGGVLCPMAMTYAAIPALRATPGIADEWIPRLLSTHYDPRDIPANEKNGATIGMFMTEKQGGSDVRSNTTRATPAEGFEGPGCGYLLNGHKWFCSAPMSDAFIALAYTENGLSCFLVPRWKPDGERNNLFIQRLKDKLGNRSNASSEIEMQDTWGVMLGEDNRGIATIMDMVQGNRIYCAVSSAGMMRQGLVQALHHTSYRQAFSGALISQPLMQNVLADLAIESEASLALAMRVARAFDESENCENAAALARVGTAISKYWICKRAPAFLFEAMECHGGTGYTEDSILPRLYREAPVNSIWEGSGNVICLDVLRTLSRVKHALPVFIEELQRAKGGNAALDAETDALALALSDAPAQEFQARALVERMAIALQAALLIQGASPAVADAFCASRLGQRWTGAFGSLPAAADAKAIIGRVRACGPVSTD